jgi:hypothetical protein
MIVIFFFFRLIKAFTDIQQAYLSKLRNTLCEKTQTFKIDSVKKLTKKKLLTSYSNNNCIVPSSSTSSRPISQVYSKESSSLNVHSIDSQHNTPPNRQSYSYWCNRRAGNLTINSSNKNKIAANTVYSPQPPRNNHNHRLSFYGFYKNPNDDLNNSANQKEFGSRVLSSSIPNSSSFGGSFKSLDKKNGSSMSFNSKPNL